MSIKKSILKYFMDPIVQDAEAGDCLVVWGQALLHNEFQDRQGKTMIVSSSSSSSWFNNNNNNSNSDSGGKNLLENITFSVLLNGLCLI